MARRRRSPLSDDEQHAAGRGGWRRRVRRTFWGGLLLVGAAIAAAPFLAAWGPIRDWALRHALPPHAGSLACDQVDLRWLGSQTLAGVTLRDAQGDPLLTVERIEVPRSLLRLVCGSRDLGAVAATRPALLLRLRHDGSNLEDFLATLRSDRFAGPLDAATDAPAPPVWRADLTVHDGRVAASELPTGRRWQLIGVVGELAGRAEAFGRRGKWQAVLEAEAAPGQGALAGNLRLGWEADEAGRLVASLVGDRVPLAPASGWLQRQARGARLEGLASVDLRCERAAPTAAAPTAAATTADAATWTVAGNLDVSAASLTFDAWQGDVLQCVDGRLQLEGTGDRQGAWEFAECRLETPWAEITWQGRWELGRGFAAPRGLLTGAALPRHDAFLAARLDLAQLAQMIPHALGLREGVRIDAGTAEASFASAPASGRRRWTAAVQLAHLLGSDAERPIRWEQPLEARAEWVGGPGEATLERAAARAPGVEAAVALAGEAYEGSFHGDLAQLRQQVDQLVDLAPWRLAGAGQGTFSYRAAGAGQFEARAEAAFNDVLVQYQERLLWQDAQLSGELSASGALQGWKPALLQQAAAKLQGSQHALDAELLEPAALVGDAPWSLRFAGRTALEAWPDWLRRAGASLPEQLAGAAAFEGRARIDAQSIHLQHVQASVDRFRMVRGPLRVEEPRIELAGDLSVVRASGALLASRLHLASSAFAAACRDVQYRPGGPEAAALRGETAFRIDLERLAASLSVPAHPQAAWPRGQLTGQATLASDGQRLSAEVSAEGAGLAWVRRPLFAAESAAALETLWSEPHLQLSGRGAYLRQDDRLDVDRLQVRSELVACQGRLTVDAWSADRNLRGEIEAQFDPARCEQLVASLLGDRVTVRGLERLRLAVEGRPAPRGETALASSGAAHAARHWSQRWKGDAATGFREATLYGLPLGPTALAAASGGGQLRFQPLDIPTGGGKLSLQPLVTWDPGPARLELPAGAAVQQVEISPAVSQAMLKYAAPVLAGATQSRGRFSVNLERCLVPLAAPRQAEVVGVLQIHELSVAPGPLIQAVGAQLRQIEQLAAAPGGPPAAAPPPLALTAPDQRVEFRVAQGRVYHRGLEFRIDDVPVRSQGSVGFDDTLSLVFEFPIQEKWVRRQRALLRLAGQMVEVPIQGTFERPRLDQQAVARISQQLVETAAEQFLGDELNRALDRLLKPR